MTSASAWLLRFAHLLKPGASVLDVACGSGRNLRWLVERGHAVTGIDRDAAAVEPLRTLAEIVVADIEADPWPLRGRRFDAVLVANYLWRPLWPTLLEAVADGGLYLHETFAHGQQFIGKPSRPDFLLQPGELLQACAGLQTVAYENGFESGLETASDSTFDPGGAGRHVQRIVSIKALGPGGEPRRLMLKSAQLNFGN
ncbi:MAG: class I SAM-dependent methyltransferase [Rubrivivax sp.]